MPVHSFISSCLWRVQLLINVDFRENGLFRRCVTELLCIKQNFYLNVHVRYSTLTVTQTASKNWQERDRTQTLQCYKV